MNALRCFLLLNCIAVMLSECVDARSINIVLSHQYKFAVDDDVPQEEVNLNNIDEDVRRRLEESVKKLENASQVEDFDIRSSSEQKENGTADGVTLSQVNTTASNYYQDTPHPEKGEILKLFKRNANLAQLANRNIDGSPTHLDSLDDQGMSEFEVISEEDILRGRKQRYKSILIYLGYTLLAVVGFSILAFCFLTDPKTCIIAFGSGSPCCLIICPCILHFVKKFLTPGAMIRDNTNKFIPGMIIHPDGKLETYEPTPEEIEAIMEIVDIIQNMA